MGLLPLFERGGLSDNEAIRSATSSCGSETERGFGVLRAGRRRVLDEGLGPIGLCTIVILVSIVEIVE